MVGYAKIAAGADPDEEAELRRLIYSWYKQRTYYTTCTESALQLETQSTFGWYRIRSHMQHLYEWFASW